MILCTPTVRAVRCLGLYLSSWSSPSFFGLELASSQKIEEPGLAVPSAALPLTCCFRPPFLILPKTVSQGFLLLVAAPRLSWG